ncbi:MAG: hypothetical protein WC503_00465 [Candidatus Shapirobacteria bacterium]
MIILKEIKKHSLNYLILGIILAVSLFLLFYFQLNFDVRDERILVCSTAALYFIWSLFHHHRRGDLQLSVILEYFLLSLFAVIVALTILV